MPRSRKPNLPFVINMRIEGEYLNDCEVISKAKGIQTGKDIVRLALREYANQCREELAQRKRLLE